MHVADPAGLDNRTDSERNSSQELQNLWLLTIAVFAVKAVWAGFASGPTVFDDELFYRLNATAIFDLSAYATPHYPPLYSLVLAPAFWFENWYQAMTILNAFWSTLVVPAAWLLARNIGLRQPLLAAALVSLLPFHMVYPHLIMSENLFVGLLTLAVAQAVRGAGTGNSAAFAFGATLALAHMTRYLFMPAAVVLAVTWITMSWVQTPRPDWRRIVDGVVVALVTYGALMGLWFWYGISSGFSWHRMLGLGAVGRAFPEDQLELLALWVSTYASYAWLTCVFGIVPIAVWLISRKPQGFLAGWSPTSICFALVTLVLAAGYWTLAVRHSYGAAYNVPVPQYMIGRYLVHIGPLFMVLGLFALQHLRDGIAIPRFLPGLATFGVILMVTIASWMLLYRDLIWELTGWFAVLRFQSVGYGELRQGHVFSWFLAGLAGFIVLVWLKPRLSGWWQCAPWAGVLIVLSGANVSAMLDGNNGKHAMVFAGVVHPMVGQSPVSIWIDDRWLTNRQLTNGLRFFGFEHDQLRIQTWGEMNASTAGDSKCAAEFLISRSSFDKELLAIYEIHGREYFLYRKRNDIDSSDDSCVSPVTAE